MNTERDLGNLLLFALPFVFLCFQAFSHLMCGMMGLTCLFHLIISLYEEVDRNKASCKVIKTWKEIMLDWDPRVLNDCHKVGSRCTAAVWQKYCKRSPGYSHEVSWEMYRGGTLPSWHILLLHEIPAPSALHFPAERRWIQSSRGTQSWQRRQQRLSLGLDEEFRSMCFLRALGGPAIMEWLRVSESEAQIYAHTFRYLGLGIQFWNRWHRALHPRQTGAQQQVCWFVYDIHISGGSHFCFPEMTAMNS